MNRRMLLLGAAATAVATNVSAQDRPSGLPVMQGGMNRTWSDKIDAAVARDSSGNYRIEGATGGFLTPRHVYETLRTYHPHQGPGFTNPNPGQLEFEAMTEYIRTLELVPLPETAKYNNSRLLRTGRTYELDLDYVVELRAGTMVWVDRNDYTPIFKANCANGIRRLVPCVFVLFEAREGDVMVNWAILGRYTPTPDCVVSIAGPSSNMGFNGMTYTPLTRGCHAQYPCDWRQIIDYVGEPVIDSGWHYVTPGWWAIKLPREIAEAGHLVALCLNRGSRNGNQLVITEATQGVGVEYTDFQTLRSGIKVAPVWYNERVVPQTYRGRTDLWWRWPSRGEYATPVRRVH